MIIDHGDYLTVIAKLGDARGPDRRAASRRGDRLGRAARHRVYLEVRVKLGPGGLPIDPEPLLAKRARPAGSPANLYSGGDVARLPCRRVRRRRRRRHRDRRLRRARRPPPGRGAVPRARRVRAGARDGADQLRRSGRREEAALRRRARHAPQPRSVLDVPAAEPLPAPAPGHRGRVRRRRRHAGARHRRRRAARACRRTRRSTSDRAALAGRRRRAPARRPRSSRSTARRPPRPAASSRSAARGRRSCAAPSGTRVAVTVLRAGWKDPRPFTLVRAQVKQPTVRHRVLERASATSRSRGSPRRPRPTSPPRSRCSARRTRSSVARPRSAQRPRRPRRSGDRGRRSVPRRRHDRHDPRPAGQRRDPDRAQGRRRRSASRSIALVDQGTASAAEILAAALRDHGRAKLVGLPTYGKGTVQTFFDLDDGSGLKLTTARYFTPKGNSLESKGLVPDVRVDAFAPEEIVEDPMRAVAPAPEVVPQSMSREDDDPQLAAAVKLAQPSSAEWQQVVGRIGCFAKLGLVQPMERGRFTNADGTAGTQRRCSSW